MIVSKIFIAGIIGALILSIGFYLIISEFNRQQEMLNKLYPEGERDMGPGSLVYAFLGIIVIMLSAYITGFIVNYLMKNVKSSGMPKLWGKAAHINRIVMNVIYSMAAGFTAGVIAQIIFSIISTINELGVSASLDLLITILTRIAGASPYFIIIALVFAIFCIFGGFFYELTFVIIKRYLGKNV